MTASRRTPAVALVGLLTAALAACGGSSTPQAAGSGGLAGQTLVLYNAQHEQTTDALVKAFEAKTGVTVKTENDDEDVLTAQIEQEGSHSPADVIYTENSNWLQQLADNGLLAPVASQTLASVPAADSGADHDWVGVSARVSVLVYNPSLISAAQLPKTVLDMAKPEYKGKLEIAPSETDFWPVICSVQKAYGTAATEAWLQGLKANAGSNDNVPDNETLVADVNSGTTAMALINHYYYFRLQSEIGSSHIHSKLSYFQADSPGFIESISGAAVLKSSKHQAAAQAFLKFLTSEQGQEILNHSASYEYPIRPGAAANSELRPLTSLHPNGFSPADLGTGLEAKKLLQEVGLL